MALKSTRRGRRNTRPPRMHLASRHESTLSLHIHPTSMQTRQGNMLQSLTNVRDFLDANAAQLNGIMQTGARKRLDDAITQLSNHLSVQDGSHIASRGAARQTSKLRRSLVEDCMAPIARIARADLPNTPAIEPLRLPKQKMSTQRLAAVARGMAMAAEPFVPVFLAAGLPADFIAQLNLATDRMIASVGDQALNQGKRTGATVGVAKKLAEGRKVVGILHTFVRTALRDDPVLLRSWHQAKRVPRLGGGGADPKAPAATSTPTPAAATTATPTAAPTPTATATPAPGGS
jgi:hypothetical protein